MAARVAGCRRRPLSALEMVLRATPARTASSVCFRPSRTRWARIRRPRSTSSGGACRLLTRRQSTHGATRKPPPKTDATHACSTRLREHADARARRAHRQGSRNLSAADGRRPGHRRRARGSRPLGAMCPGREREGGEVRATRRRLRRRVRAHKGRAGEAPSDEEPNGVAAGARRLARASRRRARLAHLSLAHARGLPVCIALGLWLVRRARVFGPDREALGEDRTCMTR
jgi:hypothetical protein